MNEDAPCESKTSSEETLHPPPTLDDATYVCRSKVLSVFVRSLERLKESDKDAKLDIRPLEMHGVWNDEDRRYLKDALQVNTRSSRLDLLIREYNRCLGPDCLIAEKILFDALPRICTGVMLIKSLTEENAIIVRLASAFGCGQLKVFKWLSPQCKSLEMERTIGEHIFKRHGNGLQVLILGSRRYPLSVGEIGKYFTHLKTLQEFEFGLNNSTKDYIEFCRASEIAPFVEFLEVLNLCTLFPNGWDSNLHDARMMAVASLLSKMKKLRRLSLRYNFLDGCSAFAFRAFCDAAIALPIQELCLSHNNFSNHAEEICRYIGTSLTLESLFLAGIEFSTDDWLSLCRAVSKSASIKMVTWECPNSKLEACCLLINPKLYFCDERSRRLGAHMITSFRIYNIPSVRAIVVILHATADREAARRHVKAVARVAGRRNFFKWLNSDLVRYLYSFFEKVSSRVKTKSAQKDINESLALLCGKRN